MSNSVLQSLLISNKLTQTLILLAESTIASGNEEYISLDGLAKLKTKALVKRVLISQEGY